MRWNRTALDTTFVSLTELDAVVPAADLVAAVQEQGAMPWWERFAWLMGGFAAAYAVLMVLMAGAGVVLAAWTRGTGALRLLGERPEEWVSAGQVLRIPGGPNASLVTTFVSGRPLEFSDVEARVSTRRDRRF